MSDWKKNLISWLIKTYFSALTVNYMPLSPLGLEKTSELLSPNAAQLFASIFHSWKLHQQISTSNVEK